MGLYRYVNGHVLYTEDSPGLGEGGRNERYKTRTLSRWGSGLN